MEAELSRMSQPHSEFTYTRKIEKVSKFSSKGRYNIIPKSVKCTHLATQNTRLLGEWFWPSASGGRCHT